MHGGENAIEDLRKGLSFAWGYLWGYSPKAELKTKQIADLFFAISAPSRGAIKINQLRLFSDNSLR
jgi:hypothetical protein